MHSFHCFLPSKEGTCQFKEYPIDEIETAIHTMEKEGIKKFAVMGQSQTAMLSLIAASLIPEISLTAAFTPSNFVMEATKTTDGAERPIDVSFARWRGESLPFHRFAFRGDEITKRMKENGKKHGDLIRMREVFDESMRLNPLTEEQLIKVENIRGKVLCFGAEDDAMWDTVRYIEKMEKRLEEHPHSCTFEKHIFELGTHYVLPQGIIKRMLPASTLLIGLMFQNGRIHKKECLKTREKIEHIVAEEIKAWKV